MDWRTIKGVFAIFCLMFQGSRENDLQTWLMEMIEWIISSVKADNNHLKLQFINYK